MADYDSIRAMMAMGSMKSEGGTASQEVKRLQNLKETSPDAYEQAGGDAALAAAMEAMKKS
jgi:hypothetical protein